jgi:copper chaperone CopZ
MEDITIKVGGVCCSHCDGKIKKAISQVEGVSAVDFSNEQSEAYVKGAFNISMVESAITNLGYSVIR